MKMKGNNNNIIKSFKESNFTFVIDWQDIP